LKLIADDTPADVPAGKAVYRATIVEVATGDQQVKTVTASNPDDAVGRVMDQVGQGLLDPEQFWETYKIPHLVVECAGETRQEE
jgi:hypothetical protein